MNKTLSYNELYNAIANLIRDSGLPIYEVYGVISTLEATTRFALLANVKGSENGENK